MSFRRLIRFNAFKFLFSLVLMWALLGLTYGFVRCFGTCERFFFFREPLFWLFGILFSVVFLWWLAMTVERVVRLVRKKPVEK